ncbi:MAG: hypothetical protein JW936_11380 [Sedimentisphaerales bacterium]|nr:hypothetical protein [Sedimentisphaerales bacterium]
MSKKMCFVLVGVLVLGLAAMAPAGVVFYDSFEIAESIGPLDSSVWYSETANPLGNFLARDSWGGAPGEGSHLAYQLISLIAAMAIPTSLVMTSAAPTMERRQCG